jgi:hypothetical protein
MRLLYKNVTLYNNMLFIKLIFLFSLFGLFINNNYAFTNDINDCNNCNMYSIYSSNIIKNIKTDFIMNYYGQFNFNISINGKLHHTIDYFTGDGTSNNQIMYGLKIINYTNGINLYYIDLEELVNTTIKLEEHVNTSKDRPYFSFIKTKLNDIYNHDIVANFTEMENKIDKNNLFQRTQNLLNKTNSMIKNPNIFRLFYSTFEIKNDDTLFVNNKQIFDKIIKINNVNFPKLSIIKGKYNRFQYSDNIKKNKPNYTTFLETGVDYIFNIFGFNKNYKKTNLIIKPIPTNIKSIINQTYEYADGNHNNVYCPCNGKAEQIHDNSLDISIPYCKKEHQYKCCNGMCKDSIYLSIARTVYDTPQLFILDISNVYALSCIGYQLINNKKNKMTVCGSYQTKINNKLENLYPNINDEIIVAFSGTASIEDIFTNINIIPYYSSELDAVVHSGFYNKMQEWKINLLNILDINNEKSPCSLNTNYRKKITLIGHSLGGAIAELMGRYLAKNQNCDVRVVTYGQPAPFFVVAQLEKNYYSLTRYTGYYSDECWLIPNRIDIISDILLIFNYNHFIDEHPIRRINNRNIICKSTGQSYDKNPNDVSLLSPLEDLLGIIYEHPIDEYADKINNLINDFECNPNNIYNMC